MGRSIAGGAMDVLLGRCPLRFSFEITPTSVGDLPSGTASVSVVWEKGSKVSFTDPAPVNPEDGSAAFMQVMRQTATIYKQGNALLPKLYTFKMQALQSPPSSSSSSGCSTPGPTPVSMARRRTVARARLDLAQFCCADAAPSATTEVVVHLEPQGTLCLSVKAVWLPHYEQACSAVQQQGLERSCGQTWGSASDFDNSTDRSSSLHGSHMFDGDRHTCSGSAELDRLLREAEAATSAKSVAPSTPGRSSSALVFKPRVVTLEALSTAPRGPSRQHCRQPSTGSLDSGVSLQQQQQQQQQQQMMQHRVLSMLQSGNTSSSSSGGPTPGSPKSSSSSSSVGGRLDTPFCTASGRKWHRRASSVPETPTILEAEREGVDPASFTAMQRPDLSACADPQPQHQGQQGSLQDSAAGMLPFGMRPSCQAATSECASDADSEEGGTVAVWVDASASSTASALLKQPCAAAEGPEGLRSLSGSMPTWLWPSSRLAVRDLTTDQIMRRISSSRDAGALQHMCRGLLCERNDWRFRATQAERTNASLQQELQQLRASEAGAHQELQRQQSEGQLLHKLVDAKLQLAQADLSQQDLKGQLERERKRHLQALARLTSLQANFDGLIHEQQQASSGQHRPVMCYL